MFSLNVSFSFQNPFHVKTSSTESQNLLPMLPRRLCGTRRCGTCHGSNNSEMLTVLDMSVWDVYCMQWFRPFFLQLKLECFWCFWCLGMNVYVHCIFCIWIYIGDHLVVSFRSCYHTSSSPAIVNLSFNHHQFCADFNLMQRKCGQFCTVFWRNFFVQFWFFFVRQHTTGHRAAACCTREGTQFLSDQPIPYRLTNRINCTNSRCISQRNTTMRDKNSLGNQPFEPSDVPGPISNYGTFLQITARSLNLQDLCLRLRIEL